MTYTEVYEYFKEKREREMCFGLCLEDETDTFEHDGCHYFVSMKGTSDYTFSLTSGPKDREVLVLEEFVTDIADKAVMFNDKLKKVVLNDKCKIIGANAFASCVNLSEINLDNVEVINPCAFKNCSSLKDVNFGKHLYYLGNRSFAQSGVKKVKFNSVLTSLCSSCFSYCLDLEKVEDLSCLIDRDKLRNKYMQGVHESIFRCCDRLKEVSIISLDKFTHDFFWHCDNLEKVEVIGYLYDKVAGEDAFYACSDKLKVYYKGEEVARDEENNFMFFLILAQEDIESIQEDLVTI